MYRHVLVAHTDWPAVVSVRSENFTWRGRGRGRMVTKNDEYGLKIRVCQSEQQFQFQLKFIVGRQHKIGCYCFQREIGCEKS